MICESKEIWKPIVGFEDQYEVSSLGRVRSLHYKWKRKRILILKLIPQRNGYLQVSLGRNVRCLVHRLVAEAFVEKHPNRPEVNHKNADKADNRACNLEYVSRRENLKHAADAGLRKDFAGWKLNPDAVRFIRANAATMEYPDLAALFGVQTNTIQRIVSRKAWKHVA